MQQRRRTVRGKERCDLARETAVAVLQRHARPLLDELGRQRILRAQPFERPLAVRQAARSQPALRDERREIARAFELDACGEALAFERIVREVLAVLFEKLLPVPTLREARQPHAAQTPADGLVLVMRDERLRALIDGADFLACISERTPDARRLQIRIQRICAQRLAVGVRLCSGIVDLLVRLAKRLAHLCK